MSGSTISGTITHTVRLGRAGYLSPLTITSTGDIAPSAYSTNGIFVPRSVQGASITNGGHIAGANGGSHNANYGNGGVGIDATASLSLINTGSIVGGHGSDFGTIHAGYHGGDGVDLRAGGSIMNAGQIVGGLGGGRYGGSSSFAGAGGNGVRERGGTFENSGTVTGGQSGGFAGGESGSVGGIGVDLFNSTASNSGLITGGYANETYSSQHAKGGVGVRLDGGTLTNTGTINGGHGPSNPGLGGHGGIGVHLTNSATLTNRATIVGGTGGYSGRSYGGGQGGVGVALMDATVTNTGTIIGGRGGLGYSSLGFGGVGVSIDGGTLITAGTIAGGTSHYDGVYYKSAAVAFGSQHGTLVIETGAVFQGAISHFVSGDVIDSTRQVTSLTFISGTLTLEHNNKAFETLSLTSKLTAANFHLAADGHGGTDITYGKAGQALPDFATGMLDAGNGGHAASHEHALPPAWHFGDHDAGSPIAALAVHPHIAG